MQPRHNRRLTLARALAFHVLVAAVWLVVATVVVAIAVGASRPSDTPPDAAFLTAIVLAGGLWLGATGLIVRRWREGRGSFSVSLAWSGVASLAAGVGLAFYPESSPAPPVSYPPVRPSPALRALGQLAFALPAGKGRASDIFVMNVDGTGLANATRDDTADDRTPTWSPDGALIAFSSDGGDAHARDIYAIDVRDRESKNLTRGAGANYDPSWSPDGEKVAFASTRWDAGEGRYDEHYEIYLYRTHGLIAKLTRNEVDDVQPAWSPNGRSIAFNTKRDGNWEIYVMNADGSEQRNVSAHPSDDEDPAWSPDGRKIAFISDRVGSGDVFVMNADGSGVRQLTRDSGGKSNPVWSPDNRMIAFISERDNGIHVMNADGTRRRRVLTGVDSDGGLAWRPRLDQRSAPQAGP